MNEQQDRLNVLLKQHAENALSAAEREELSALLLQDWNQTDQAQRANEPDWEKMVTEITGNDMEPAARRIPFYKRTIVGYAATLFLAIGSVAYMYVNTGRDDSRTPQVAEQPKVENDVLPGVDKAILTLSNGHKVELNARARQTISDGSLAISNTDGNLIYKETDVVVYNTMSTLKGGQYKLYLPDGSKVWLNAASSITFPTAFPGPLREVSITGEVYFEVTPNANQPFIINTIKDQVAVLGTQLNINSYADEPSVKVSLLEGSVRVASKLLKPGDAYFAGKVKKTNLDLDLAWKNGVFSFDKTNIEAVMRQLSRWYNIEVIYPDGVPSLIISGSMGRDLKLSQTLAGLKLLGVNAVLENNILIVKH
jgi:ferric-dicitrate binding protein FerR (iron transport regulator)